VTTTTCSPRLDGLLIHASRLRVAHAGIDAGHDADQPNFASGIGQKFGFCQEAGRQLDFGRLVAGL
jgi:hypothetical protein